MAKRLITLILFFVAIIGTILCFTDNAILPPSSLHHQQQEEDEELDSRSMVISSHFAAIPVPSYVTNPYLNNDDSKVQPTAKDHNPLALMGKTTSRICGNVRGEKRSVACSFLLSDRSWRVWKQHLSQVFYTNKRRVSTIIHNWFVKNAVDGALDHLETIQWKIHDWRYSPSLEWYLLKAQWTSFLYQCMDKYLDPELYHLIHNFITSNNVNRLNISSGLQVDKGLSSSTTSTTTTTSNKIDSNARSSSSNKSDVDNGPSPSITSNSTDSETRTSSSNKEDVVRYHGHRTKHINLNHHDLEPDNEGCYHDIFGTTLCVGQQSMLDDDELKDRMNALFESMSYEDRSHTLRFQQRFIQWATKTSAMTSRAVHQAQSLWLQHSQEAYQFLDDALDLVPSCTNDRHTNTPRLRPITKDNYQAPSSVLSATTSAAAEPASAAAETTCPNVIFPFSVSPLDKSLESSVFSLGQALHMRPRSPPPPCVLLPRPFLSLKPARQQQWTACAHNSYNRKQNLYDDDGTAVPRTTRTARAKQCRSLLSQPLEPYNRMQYHYLLARLEKKMMKKLMRLEKEALQEYYRAMASGPHSWKINYHRNPQQQHHQQEEQERQQRPGYATQRTYQQLRLYTTIAFRKQYVKSIQQLTDASRRYDALAMEQVKHARKEWRWVERQRRNQIRNHHRYQQNHQHHHEEQVKQQQGLTQNDDVDYDARCQQWWRRTKSWRLVRLLSSVAEQLGYYRYNKGNTNSMRDDDHTLLSMIASYLPSPDDPPRPPTDTRAAVFIGQRADMAIQTHRRMLQQHWNATFQEMDRRSHSMWVSAMDQVQGRHRILPNCNATCAYGLLLFKLALIVVFIIFL